jgi:hypothetical protein
VPASISSGAAAPAALCATAVAKANADAACPEGNDAECGIGTRRSSGTPAASRSGRVRRAANLKPMLTSAESSATAARPVAAPRRPFGPPVVIAAAIAIQSRDWSAASDRRRSGRSRVGVGVSAIAR